MYHVHRESLGGPRVLANPHAGLVVVASRPDDLNNKSFILWIYIWDLYVGFICCFVMLDLNVGFICWNYMSDECLGFV